MSSYDNWKKIPKRFFLPLIAFFPSQWNRESVSNQETFFSLPFFSNCNCSVQDLNYVRVTSCEVLRTLFYFLMSSRPFLKAAINSWQPPSCLHVFTLCLWNIFAGYCSFFKASLLLKIERSFFCLDEQKHWLYKYHHAKRGQQWACMRK